MNATKFYTPLQTYNPFTMCFINCHETSKFLEENQKYNNTIA